MKSFPWIRIMLVISIGIAAGFVQEWIKVGINYYLDVSNSIPGFYSMSVEERSDRMTQSKQQVPYDYYYSHSTIGALDHMQYQTIVILKWIVTFVFILVFFFINLILLKLATGDATMFKYLLLSYAVVLAIATGSYAISITGLETKSLFSLSRRLINLLESMIPSMILFPASFLYSGSKSK